MLLAPLVALASHAFDTVMCVCGGGEVSVCVGGG